jgi:hypothetical protein
MAQGRLASQFSFILKLTITMVAFLVVAGLGLKGIDYSVSSSNQGIVERNVERIQTLSEEHPEVFARFNMATLTCEEGAPSLFTASIDCYIDDIDGHEFHLSNKRLQNLIK